MTSIFKVNSKQHEEDGQAVADTATRRRFDSLTVCLDVLRMRKGLGYDAKSSGGTVQSG
jgi:hypothetical protein